MNHNPNPGLMVFSSSSFRRQIKFIELTKRECLGSHQESLEHDYPQLVPLPYVAYCVGPLAEMDAATCLIQNFRDNRAYFRFRRRYTNHFISLIGFQIHRHHFSSDSFPM